MQGIKVDLTGQRFGKLLVLGLAPKRNRGYQLWYVQCDCGGPIKSVITTNLTTKRGTKSCGCLTRIPLGEAARNVLLKWYKNNAKRQGRVWGLTVSQFTYLTQLNCSYCGTPPKAAAKPNDSSNGVYIYNGLDRISNELGYTEANVVPCCKTCNWAKGKQSHVEFMAWVTDLCQYQLQKQTTNILIREQAVSASA